MLSWKLWCDRVAAFLIKVPLYAGPVHHPAVQVPLRAPSRPFPRQHVPDLLVSVTHRQQPTLSIVTRRRRRRRRRGEGMRPTFWGMTRLSAWPHIKPWKDSVYSSATLCGSLYSTTITREDLLVTWSSALLWSPIETAMTFYIPNCADSMYLHISWVTRTWAHL